MKTAFTLAEVLITLTIIGVIAALTIPTLMKNYQHAQLESAFSKAYSTLQNTTKMILVEDPIETWPAKGLNQDETEILKMYANKINGATIKKIDTDNAYVHYFLMTPTILVGLSSCVTDCSFNAQVYGHGVQNVCIGFHLDTNGLQKPNKAGYDRFSFMLSQRPNGSLDIVPPGTDATVSTKCTDAGCGKWGCRCDVAFKALHDPNYFKNLP